MPILICLKKMMRKRQLIIVEGTFSLLKKQLAQVQTPWAIFSPEPLGVEFPNCQEFLFSHTKNALGRAFSNLLFDARKSLNLEALSIACGTLQAGGTLLFWVEDWQHFIEQIDEDSQRWAETGKQACPVFRQFFTHLVKKFDFPVVKLTEKTPLLVKTAPAPFTPNPKGIEAQEKLLNRLLKTKKNIVLTAKRGRGKSALAGLWAEKLLQQNQKLIITAPNKQSLQTLAKFCSEPLPFFAPDDLLKCLKKGEKMGEILLIDEAAQLPLAVLKPLISYFPQVFCTTTIDSYEGTGQGFALKFMTALGENWQKERLTIPLRWGERDPLEDFMEELLLQNTDERKQKESGELLFHPFTRQQMQQENYLSPFYQLLSLAHYRTTPLDLRRLFDAPKQQFFLATNGEDLKAGIWSVEEGGMTDLHLIRAIQKGERRPSGNLVAQLLTQMYLTEEACTLRSLRISRIAVTPDEQRQGLGKKLLQSFCEAQKNYDFISVSFGFTKELANFWIKNGFQLAYFSEHKGTTSGCYSAVALLPLTEKGKVFCEKVCPDFRKNFALFEPPEKALMNFFLPEKAEFNETHRQMLEDFAYAHRSFFMTLPALQLWKEKTALPPLLTEALENPFQKRSRQALKDLRECVRQSLK